VEGACQLLRSTPHSQSTPPVVFLSSFPTANLLTPRRLDLVLKWRFFRHLFGSTDNDAERLYRWHIVKRSGHRMTAKVATDQWKLSIDDYVQACRSLAASMASVGFHVKGAVPIDPDHELLGGAHRVACATALGIKNISVTESPQKVWAPAWDYEWFVNNGMSNGDLVRLKEDWEAMKV
jgi:hypothetical protein